MTETNARPKEIVALAGARAIPPLILVLFHYCEGHEYLGAKWFDLPVGKGYLWVEFFFALSGFVLAYVYGARWREFRRGSTYLDFLKARLARLYPLHLTMLFVILAMVIVLRWLAARGGYVSIYDEPYHPIDTLPTFIANLFLVQGWNLFPYLSWNGASWFVSVEFLLCLLFPVYLLISRGGWLGAVGLIAGGSVALALLAASSKHGLDLTFHNGMYRGMAAFAVGVGLSTLYRLALAQGADRLPTYVFSLAQLAVFALLLVRYLRHGLGTSPRRHRHRVADDGLDLHARFRPRHSREILPDTRPALARRIVLRDLHRTDRAAPVSASCAAASLSRARAISSSVGPGPRGRPSGFGWSRRYWWSPQSCGAGSCLRSSSGLPTRPCGAILRGPARAAPQRLDASGPLGHHSPARYSIS